MSSHTHAKNSLTKSWLLRTNCSKRCSVEWKVGWNVGSRMRATRREYTDSRQDCSMAEAAGLEREIASSNNAVSALSHPSVHLSPFPPLSVCPLSLLLLSAD